MEKCWLNDIANYLRKIIISGLSGYPAGEKGMAQWQGVAAETVTDLKTTFKVKPDMRAPGQPQPTPRSSRSQSGAVLSPPVPAATQKKIAQSKKTELIGTAVPADLFLLIETPLPWNKPALLSDGVPDVVRQALKPHLGKYPGLRVHLIANEATALSSTRRLLFFQRQSHGLQQYGCWELESTSPEQMAEAIAAYLSRPPEVAAVQPPELTDIQGSALLRESDNRHFLICTHASHNECCGVKGYPLYKQAIDLTKSLNLANTNIWQVSHIGGHRYAPTLIDLPQGRYYGELNPGTLELLLQQRGDWSGLMPCYRGWSLLPKLLQVQEKLKFENYGWSWLQRGSWKQF